MWWVEAEVGLLQDPGARRGGSAEPSGAVWDLWCKCLDDGSAEEGGMKEGGAQDVFIYYPK